MATPGALMITGPADTNMAPVKIQQALASDPEDLWGLENGWIWNGSGAQWHWKMVENGLENLESDDFFASYTIDIPR